MDEPTSNLDPRARRRLIELLQGFEHTKIVATHDLDLVLDVCARTIVLHGGKVAADGPTARDLQRRRAARRLRPGTAAQHEGVRGMRADYLRVVLIRRDNWRYTSLRWPARTASTRSASSRIW